MAAEAPSPELKWQAPEGWQEMPPKTMRLVSFQVGGSPDAECYVTLLNNDGGGIEANVNRWRQQMGQEPLTAADLAALPTITVLGKPSPMVEMAGTYMDKPGQALVGLVCLLEGNAVFVKMTGPAEVLTAERARFTAFCESLQ
jgi:hypothetical protein